MAAKEENKHSGFKFKYCVYAIIILILFFALVSHHPADFAVLQGGSDSAIKNWVGITGAHISCIMLLFFGIAAFPITAFLILCAARPAIRLPVKRRGYLGALLVICLGTTILFGMYPEYFSSRTAPLGIGHAGEPSLALSGGVIGQQLAAPKHGELRAGFMRHYIGDVGTMVVAIVFITVGLVFVWIADWHGVFMHLLTKGAEIIPEIKLELPRGQQPTETPTPPQTSKPLPIPAREEKNETVMPRDQKPRQTPSTEEAPLSPKPESSGSLLQRIMKGEVSASSTGEFTPPPSVRPQSTAKEPEPEPVPAMPVPTPLPPTPEPPPQREERESIATPPQKTPQNSPAKRGTGAYDEFVLPPVSMLNKGKEGGGETQEALSRCSAILQETLESFKVDGQVAGIISGPRVTRYEILLAPGVKVEKVANISNNIAMQLEAESIRVLAPIPGKNAVGVEVPNSRPSAVFLRGLMESPQWKDNKCGIPVILGKDVSGRPVVMDLAKAPHLLIAGATGSGKSVCMNTLITSLLFRFRPDELRMIMVDPKVVEMEMYTRLPHLITPVVNDPHKVPIALRWAVNEMERRYRILAKVKVRNLEGFNCRPISNEPVLDDNGERIPDKLPYLVLIIDELADVMMTDAKSDVETSVARIAQKGRAAGIHIVIATQRPSTNIITGVIKANLPTRIAFRVGSIVDSRVILDQKGAESLLGRGDMLYVPPGSANLERIQGAMVDDADIEKVVDFVASQAEQEFDDQILSGEGDDDGGGTDELPGAEIASGEYIDDFPDLAPIVKKYLNPEDGELIQKALEITLLERKVSTSYLQRRLGIGYNRAAELIDVLEARGIVSAPLPGGSKRDILVFDEIENG